jgi:hypothetical protein
VGGRQKGSHGSVGLVDGTFRGHSIRGGHLVGGALTLRVRHGGRLTISLGIGDGETCEDRERERMKERIRKQGDEGRF